MFRCLISISAYFNQIVTFRESVHQHQTTRRQSSGLTYFQRSFPHTSRPVELKLRFLPHGILDPKRDRVAIAADTIFKLLPLALPDHSSEEQKHGSGTHR